MKTPKTPIFKNFGTIMIFHRFAFFSSDNVSQANIEGNYLANCKVTMECRYESETNVCLMKAQLGFDLELP